MTTANANNITLFSCGNGHALSMTVGQFNTYVEAGNIHSRGGGYIFWNWTDHEDGRMTDSEAAPGYKANKRDRTVANKGAFNGEGFTLKTTGNPGNSSQKNIVAMPVGKPAGKVKAKAKAQPAAPVAPVATVQPSNGSTLEAFQAKQAAEWEAFMQQQQPAAPQPTAAQPTAPAPAPAPAIIDGGYRAGLQPSAVSEHGPVTVSEGPNDGEHHFTFYKRMVAKGLSKSEAKSLWSAHKAAKVSLDGVTLTDVAPQPPQPKVPSSTVRNFPGKVYKGKPAVTEVEIVKATPDNLRTMEQMAAMSWPGQRFEVRKVQTVRLVSIDTATGDETVVRIACTDPTSLT